MWKKFIFLPISLFALLSPTGGSLNVKFNQTSFGRWQLVKSDQVVYDVPSVWMQVAYLYETVS
jgi:hypothetical protein